MISFVPDTEVKALAKAVFRGVPATAVDAYFKMAMNRFFTESLVFQHQFALRVQDNVTTYRPSKYLPEQLKLYSVNQVVACGTCLPVLQDCTRCGGNTGFSFNNTVLEINMPGCCDAVTIDGFLTTSDSICGEIPSILIEHQYAFQTLLESMILGIPGNKWTDARAAENKRREYLRQVQLITDKRYHGNTDQPVILPSPRFI
jgi:hypothetical protein